MSRRAVTAAAIAGVDDPFLDTVVIDDDGRIAALARSSEVGDLPIDRYDEAILSASFTDSHLHPLGYAALAKGTSLAGAETPADLHTILSHAASRLGDGQALMAQRLSEAALGRLPTRHDLDLAVPNRPVIAYRYCGHVAVLNTAALAVTGIDERTPDPFGGSLDRDSSGVPTGVLRETAADLAGPALEPLIPPPAPEQVLQAMEGLVAAGITHVGAMVAADQPLWCGVGNELEQLCQLAPDLPLDMDVMVIADTPESLTDAAHRVESAGGRLRFWGWKTFADGSLGGHTAAMWERYVDVNTTGIVRLGLEATLEMGRTALDLGGVVAIHAVGDRAVDEILDLFDQLLSEGVDSDRLRMEHVSVLTDEAVRRFAATGVIASIQPSFLTSESGWVPHRLGEGRNPYRFATMLEAGVRMIGGSDCPVERPDPLVGMDAAVNRKGWQDGEYLDADAALSLYTDAPARHFRRPRPLGTGSPADLVIVNGSPGSPDARIEAVYQGGRVVNARPVAWPG